MQLFSRSNSDNVTVMAYIQSDLIYLLIMALTFVCVIEARGQTQFLFYNIQDVFRIDGMLKIFNFWGIGAVLEQTNISAVFKNSLGSG